MLRDQSLPTNIPNHVINEIEVQLMVVEKIHQMIMKFLQIASCQNKL